MARLNLTTPFAYNGKTIDHLHVLRKYWARQASSALGETQKGIYRVLYALHHVDSGNTVNPNSDAMKFFTRDWFDDDPDEPWNKTDQWLHENNGEHTGTFVA